MNVKLVLFALLISLANSCCLAHRQLDLQPLLEEHYKVFRQMTLAMTTNRAALVGYEETNACFDWYMREQTIISTTYNNEFNNCVKASTEAKEKSSEQSVQDRSDLMNSGNTILTAFNKCESFSDSLQFFKCYYDASNGNTANLLQISTKAERVLNNLTIVYRAIDDTERVCTSEARGKNILTLTESTDKLNSCLGGEWSPSSTTESPTTTTTTTETVVTTVSTAATETPSGGEETVVTTEAPSGGEDSDGSGNTERAPEEDISDYQPKTRMNIWNIMKRM